MPKQLINAIGLIISLGVVVLAVALIAVPLYLQSLTTDQQAQAVADTNAIYEAQVDHLQEESGRKAEIDASVAALRAQIPQVSQLDGVFEVVGRAAEATGVTIQEITAGEIGPFVARAGEDGTSGVLAPATGDSQAETGGAAADPTPVPTEQSSDSSANSPALTSTGRQQIDFTIRVGAADMAQTTAFLDALRAGPRLLNSMTAITGLEPSGTVTLRISALAYVDSEG